MEAGRDSGNYTLMRGLLVPNCMAELDPQPTMVNNRGDLLISQALPELTEITRLGDSWEVITSSAFAALTAVPTTVAALSLWNGEPATGKCYIIDSLFWVKIVVDATQANNGAMFLNNNVTPVTAPTDAALSVRSTIGKKYGGKARTQVGATITNDGWFPVGNSVATAAVTGGSAWQSADIPIKGMHIIPPGGMLNLHIANIGAAAAQFHAGVRWHESQIVWRA